MTTKEFNNCLDRIRMGDTTGLRDIYNIYYEKMTHVAYTLVMNYHVAEDIASDFIKYILENANNIKPIEFPHAWICRCIRNNTIDYIRRDTKLERKPERTDKAFVRNQNNAFMQNIEKYESLKDLDGYEKELVLLHYVYGLKYREISEIIHQPVGTIKSAINRLKKKIKKL